MESVFVFIFVDWLSVSLSYLEVFDFDGLGFDLYLRSSMVRTVVRSFVWALSRGFAFLGRELLARRFLDGDLSWMYTVLDELDGSMSDWNSDFMEANVLFRAPWIIVPSSSLMRDCILLRRMLLTLFCSVNDCS